MTPSFRRDSSVAYVLDTDPGETGAARADPNDEDDLRNRLLALLAEGSGERLPAALDEETIARLKALGYLQ